MSWPRQGSQNPLDNRECKWKTCCSWVWGYEVVHAVKGSFEDALPPNIFQYRLVQEGPEIPQCPGVYRDSLLSNEQPPM